MYNKMGFYRFQRLLVKKETINYSLGKQTMRMYTINKKQNDHLKANLWKDT